MKSKHVFLISINVLLIIIIILAILGFDILEFNETGFRDSENIQSTPTPTPILTESQKKIIIIEEILDKYSQDHIYIGDDVFDCDNMAQDVWNILKAKGINSKLVLGNVDHFAALTLDDCDHVWLLAEFSPDEWIAIETTGGYVVYQEDNEKYYKGFTFANPKNYREFIDLYEDYIYQYADYENEREYYSQLVKIYNNANYYEQIQLKSALDVTKNNLEVKERRVLETQVKIETILEYG